MQTNCAMAKTVLYALCLSVLIVAINSAATHNHNLQKRQDPGQKGEPGEPGAQGPIGPTGPAGPKGEPGRTGPSGPLGANGDRGDSGASGRPGLPGDRGAPGAKGDRGDEGRVGPTGREGPTGEPGERGTDGRPGNSGARGDRGIPGPAGEDGKDGDDGRNGLPGAKGEAGFPGDRGPQGESCDCSGSSRGVTYVRWGQTICNGSDVVYVGRAAGSRWDVSGGTSDYICLPNVPEYGKRFQPGAQLYSALHGVEYQTFTGAPLDGVHDHNAPCVVCHAGGRTSLLMLPARRSCPDETWTREYEGYLMSGFGGGSRRSAVCVDESAQMLDGEGANMNGALFYHVEATCNGIDCPPYDAEKELACAVCTK